MSKQRNSRPRILVVEDERLTAQHLRQTLSRLGYDVVDIAASGEEALRQAEQHDLDLVIADIGLEGEMDGIEVADRMREQWVIPTVFLTAYGDEKTMRRANIAEPYGYLVKPFDAQELHATIEVALQQHGLSEQRRQEADANKRALERTRVDLNALASRLFSIQEEERQRVARDLHDDIGQRMAAVQIELEMRKQELMTHCE